jgi:hypothetical protein
MFSRLECAYQDQIRVDNKFWSRTGLKPTQNGSDVYVGFICKREEYKQFWWSNMILWMILDLGSRADGKKP